MASSTPYYGMGYFDFGDPLGTDFSGQVEVQRFLFLDKQIYGLMSVFGNGVISGWTVSQEEDFTISISEGYGNIDFVACRSVIPYVLENLISNTFNYIYARSLASSRYDESVEFFVSSSLITTVANVVLLATVITDANSIVSIDNSVRDEIDFIDLIKDTVKNHKHRGGASNASKINLGTEVQGQLPSFRIADFDAEKITTGTFDLSRMPSIDHQQLKNVGLLTHSQLDTFVQTLEATNKELFGEIGTSGLLQLILAMKYIHDDIASPNYFSSRTIDQTMVNELAIIPGITPDTSIDFDNSTAAINLIDHYISGIPAASGTSFYVTYDTDLAWNSSYSRQHLVVGNDQVTLAFNDADESSILNIENFESATAQNQVLSGSEGLFTEQTVVLSDDAKIVATNSQVTEGYWAGQFSHAQRLRSQFVKEYSTSQDWSSYDRFVLSIKCTSMVHGAVMLYFVNSQGEKSAEYLLLDENEITEDLERNNFEVRDFDLTNIPFNNDIKSFVIYSDDIDNPFSFIVDYINIQKAVLLPPQGSLVLRYNSNTNVVFSQLEWSSSEPTGTSVSIRARAANSSALLTRSEFTPYLSSGDLINLSGTDLEIEILFESNTERTLAPVLSMLRFMVLAQATSADGIMIDTTAEFARGGSQNVTVHDSPTYLSLQTPVSVDSYYFFLDNSANQVYENTGSLTPYTQAELPVFGSKTPISPNQVFRAVESSLGAVSISNFGYPRSIVRTVDRHFVIADTYNDRILELDESGEVVNGFGSINYQHNEDVFPIAASVDVRTGILYIVWSRPIPFASVQVNRIVIQATGRKIQLVQNSDKIQNKTTTELTVDNPTGQILPIYLSDYNATLISSFPATSSYISFSTDVLTGDINTESDYYLAIKTALGIPLFVGNFMYIDGIFSPTYANKTDTNKYMVANATLGVKSFTQTDISLSLNVANIVEVDSDNVISFASNVMAFSPFVPGRVDRIDSNTIIVGGIRPDGTEKKDNLNFRIISGDTTTKTTQKATLKEVFFGGTTKCVGAMIVYDTRDLSTLFEYISPEGLLVSDVDIDPVDGLYVVAETSFDASGRIIKLDLSGNISSSYGEGLYGIINDINIQHDGSMLIST